MCDWVRGLTGADDEEQEHTEQNGADGQLLLFFLRNKERQLL